MKTLINCAVMAIGIAGFFVGLEVMSLDAIADQAIDWPALASLLLASGWLIWAENKWLVGLSIFGD